MMGSILLRAFSLEIPANSAARSAVTHSDSNKGEAKAPHA